ncbi:MAG: CoB--CoM heterodisulfide reductase iron-sulfur subunit B family protein [Dehalococcoidia bacterium]|nr:CoB--CoM heterodisulfide reductase iron-sulfur subunit B family protein [Dehalococcoidia bacterium]
MKFAYYPGCSLESTAKEYDLSVRAVCQILGVGLEEIPDWNCCGASSGHCTNFRLSHALAGRNLALTERENLDLAVACPACYLRLKTTRHEARENARLREELPELIGMPYEAKFDVRHLLDIIYNDIQIEETRKRVKRPLAGLKLVSYYGCFLVRPPKVTHFDDPENPQSMDILMDALGADVLDWSSKVDCCGGSLSLTRRDIVVRLVSEIAAQARGVGAEAIVTACPLCMSNLESRQKPDGEKALPIFYFSELMGLAFGVSEAKGWFKKHLVNPVDLLASHGLL